MKIRQGFVTNSSSSSFIIAYKGDISFDLDDETLKKYPYLKSCAELFKKAIFEDIGGYETESAEVFETLEDWDDHWIQENKYYVNDYGYEMSVDGIMRALTAREKTYGWSYQSEKDDYLKPAEYLKKGYKVFEKRISYDDEWIEDLLRGLEDGENLIIINDKER